jgi:hypothetical protein
MGAHALAIAAAAAIMLAISCANPLGARKNARPAGSGTLMVSLPAAAAWIAQIPAGQDAVPAGKDGPSPAFAGKAFCRSTSYTVEVLDASGEAVIPPASAETASSGSLSALAVDVPQGSGYTVRLSVYNAAASAANPVVRGEARGVAVVSGADTPLAITCLPVNPGRIPMNGSQLYFTLPSAGEKWFSMDCAAGESYAVTMLRNGISMALFDGDGNFLSSGVTGLEYAATVSGTVYVCALATGSMNNYAYLYASPMAQEGSVGDPIALELNVPHVFTAGPGSSSKNTSYYRFTTTEAGDYAFVATCYCDTYLYLDPNFSNEILARTDRRIGTVASGLAADTTYYLKIRNKASGQMSAAGTIVDPSVIRADSGGEGSLSDPVPLPLGTSRPAAVGGKPYNSASYYRFRTGAGKDYRIILPASGNTLLAMVYADPSFSGFVDSLRTTQARALSKEMTLSPSTTYYLEVINEFCDQSMAFQLLVDRVGEPAFTPLPSDGAWMACSLDSSGGSAWFEADVVGGRVYTLNWDDAYQGSGLYSLDIRGSVFHGDRQTAYYRNIDSAYNAGITLNVPEGETKLYVQIMDYSYYKTGTFALKLQ